MEKYRLFDFLPTIDLNCFVEEDGDWSNKEKTVTLNIREISSFHEDISGTIIIMSNGTEFLYPHFNFMDELYNSIEEENEIEEELND